MARPSLSPGEKMTTISFRANPASIRRILSAIGDRGVKKSEVFRILIEEASDAAISRAIKKAELEQLKVLSSLSVNDLKLRRVAALKTVAWIDAQLAAASQQILSK